MLRVRLGLVMGRVHVRLRLGRVMGRVHVKGEAGFGDG